MKKLCIIICGFLAPFVLKSQVLTGVVYNEENKVPLAYANVYYGGSLTATATNVEGEFTIPAIGGNIPLLVSCIGFNTITITDLNPKTRLKVFLTPKVLVLNEVLIINEGITAHEKMRLFKEEFLGTSANARSCVITNMDDINLTYSKIDNSLKASSDKPIDILNTKLGYRISYFLDNFIKSPKGTSFEGNFVFEEIWESSARKQILKNREQAYKGSRMQFIRSLYSNTLQQDQFKLTSPGSFALASIDSMPVPNSQDQKLIRLHGRVAITYGNTVSFLSQKTKISIIDKRGFYDVSLKWSGKMAEERIGDLLPYEYITESNKKK